VPLRVLDSSKSLPREEEIGVEHRVTNKGVAIAITSRVWFRHLKTGKRLTIQGRKHHRNQEMLVTEKL
jgi:hypothetical protein